MRGKSRLILDETPLDEDLFVTDLQRAAGGSLSWQHTTEAVRRLKDRAMRNEQVVLVEVQSNRKVLDLTGDQIPYNDTLAQYCDMLFVVENDNGEAVITAKLAREFDPSTVPSVRWRPTLDEP